MRLSDRTQAGSPALPTTPGLLMPMFAGAASSHEANWSSPASVAAKEPGRAKR